MVDSRVVKIRVFVRDLRINNINVNADGFTSINIQKSTILDQHIFEFFQMERPQRSPQRVK